MTRLAARVTETESQNQHSCQLTVLAVCTKSSRPGLSSVTGQVKASGAQSYWPVQCDGTSEVFWKSCATHLTQWALPEQLVHGSPSDCWARRGLLHKWLLGPKRSAAQEVVFQSTGLRDLKGVPRFTVLQVTVGPKRPAAQGVLSLAVSQNVEA